MYIRLVNQAPESYSTAQLRRDNSNVSFPKDISEATLAEYDVYPLIVEADPVHNPKTERVVNGVIEQDVGQWVQRRVVEAIPEPEILYRLANIDAAAVQNPEYLASVVRLLANKLLDLGTLTDEERQQVAVAYEAWVAGLEITAADVTAERILRFEGELYKVLQAHTTAVQWLPPETASLYVKVHDPAAGPQPWVQPTGTQDAYNIPERVTHDNPNDSGNIWVYESAIDDNTAEPGRDGTSDRWWTPIQAV